MRRTSRYTVKIIIGSEPGYDTQWVNKCKTLCIAGAEMIQYRSDYYISIAKHSYHYWTRTVSAAIDETTNTCTVNKKYGIMYIAIRMNMEYKIKSIEVSHNG